MLEFIRHLEERQFVSAIRENSRLCSFDSGFLKGGGDIETWRGGGGIEIINNTRGGIEGEIWERGNGGQIDKSNKTGCSICFACHYYKHSPKILN